ncbi:uncharacterized protein PHALS_12786 [Plasmopara halstedii]|uniref:Uncharacterized protein n=1 Tax=Plasmopara halstedii TaxID=4781 RepID=A0A0P1ANC6_PLAHL|nr:uncharacterized protein PHALS_12786 [Plasmopara halstedii]CEG42518.1 hypothetical protein PHALS_12786 [Plasmopara halstedii]|eukprot:XP_024578887.1 hypothetical protein PHALS_12786 [Plasmopara halstedii]
MDIPAKVSKQALQVRHAVDLERALEAKETHERMLKCVIIFSLNEQSMLQVFVAQDTSLNNCTIMNSTSIQRMACDRLRILYVYTSPSTWPVVDFRLPVSEDSE